MHSVAIASGLDWIIPLNWFTWSMIENEIHRNEHDRLKSILWFRFDGNNLIGMFNHFNQCKYPARKMTPVLGRDCGWP
jgi:hypothetical protein